MNWAGMVVASLNLWILELFGVFRTEGRICSFNNSGIPNTVKFPQHKYIIQAKTTAKGLN